jgi:hypothetical protein
MTMHEPLIDPVMISAALPGLQVEVPVLWRSPLPCPIAVGAAVRRILEADHP